MLTTTNRTRTFLVVPDEYDGGSEWEGFVLADSPEEACVLWREHITSEVTSFKYAPDGRLNGNDVWTVRELPQKLGDGKGAVPWENLSVTFWTATH